MPAFFRRRITHKTLTTPLLATPWTTGSQAPQAEPRLPALASARLEALQAHPDLAGDRVYRADVRPLRAQDAPALFVYARHVESSGADRVASHLTYLPRGELIIEERVTSSAGHAFQRLDVINRQTGWAGSVVLDAGQRLLRFERTDAAQHKEERVTEPVVAGPNLHGHILQHWEALSQAERLPVRMVVLARMETLGFDIHQTASNDQISTFQITPSHLLLRLVVSPLRVTFDNATRRVLRYEGRVPPMRAVGHKLVDLDAAVDYHWDTDRYR